MRLKLAFAAVILLLCFPWMPSSSALAFQTDRSSDDIWTEPLNLSQSGAASQPRLVSTTDGRVQAFWWDSFDGLMTSVYENGSWSQPGAAPIASENITTTPDVFYTEDGQVHALWIETGARGGATPLRHSQLAFGTTAWSTPVTLGSSVIAFDVSLAESGAVTVAYLSTQHTVESPAGVYLARSLGGGNSWGEVRRIDPRIYYRLLSAETAHIRIFESQDPETEESLLYVTWNDPRSGGAMSSISVDGGETWSTPEQVEVSGEGISGLRLINLSEPGEALRLWEASGQEGCEIYQQQSTRVEEAITGSASDGNAWDAVQAAIEDLPQCPTRDRFIGLQDGALWVWGERSDELTLNLWSEEEAEWSLPYRKRFAFQDEDYNELIQLTDLHLAQVGDRLAVIGSDPSFNEIWVSFALTRTLDLVYSDAPDWSIPVLVQNGTEQTEAPESVTDANGVAHLFWSQDAPDSAQNAAALLYHSEWNGNKWTPPVRVLRRAQGSTIQPSAAVHQDGRLLLAWRGGEVPGIYYAWANSDLANNPAEWSEPRLVPGSSPGGSSPVIKVDDSGAIYIAFVIPINEGRGIYLTTSMDRGETWSEAVQVFDGAATQWEMVGEPNLTFTGSGQLHLSWIRYPYLQGGGSNGLYYSRSGDSGNTWSSPALVTDRLADWSQLIGFGEEIVHRVWREGGTGSGVFHQFSMDNGATWSSQVRVSNNHHATVLPGLTADSSGSLHLVEFIENGAEQEIHYSYWNGSNWLTKRSFNPNLYGTVPLDRLALSFFPNDSLALIFAGLRTGLEPEEGPYEILFSHLPVEVSGDAPVLSTATPNQAPTREPTATALPGITPTPTYNPQDLANAGPLPGGAPSENDTWFGLSLGIGLAVLIVVVSVGFVFLRRGGPFSR